MATTDPDEVDAYLSSSRHARKPEIETIRSAVLAAHPALTEQLKWNAPSFGIDGQDRVTFRLPRTPRPDPSGSCGRDRRTRQDCDDEPSEHAQEHP